MASDRAKAKLDVAADSSEESEPAELSTVLSSASAFRQELAVAKEQHRHAETMKDKEVAEASDKRGKFAKYLGGTENAPIAVAAIAVVAALAIALYCLHMAAYSSKPDSWFHEAEGLAAIVTLALGYIFGKGSKE